MMTAPRGPTPPPINLTPTEQQALETLVHRPSTPQRLALRGRIVLACATGLNNTQVARQLAISADVVRLWRRRWLDTAPGDPTAPPLVAARLVDLPRSGSPGRFSAQQCCQLIAMGCEKPAGSDRPISHWTPREMAAEAQKRGIVDHISRRHMARLLKRGR
jgi:putative transposase